MISKQEIKSYLSARLEILDLNSIIFCISVKHSPHNYTTTTTALRKPATMVRKLKHHENKANTNLVSYQTRLLTFNNSCCEKLTSPSMLNPPKLRLGAPDATQT